MTGPYVGPRPFGWGDKEDADRFFGRDREASELRFRVHANPVLLLYAQSGAGKTSLLNAKLVPELTKDGFCVLPPVRIRTFQREEDETAIRDTTYLQRVTQAWKQLAAQPETPKELFPLFLRERLTNPKNAGDNLGKLLLDETGKSKFVLVFDQFEELFAPGVSNAEHQINFFGQIADCVQNNPSVRFVFALRSEWLAVFDKCANQIPTPMRSRFYLEQLKKDAAEQAIIKPVELFGWTFNLQAAQTLSRRLRAIRREVSPGKFETEEGEFVEPVQLQIVCQDIWERAQKTNAQSKQIVEADIGSVDDPLGEYYAKAVAHVAGLTGLKEGRIREWVARNLITEALTRGTVFKGASTTGGIANRVPELLDEARLVRAERRNGSWYELVHDSFIRPILKSNQEWRTKLSKPARIEQELRDRAHARGPLLDVVELAQAKILLEKETDETDESNELLSQLVERSKEELRRRKQESERLERMRHKMWLGAIAASALVIAALGILLWKMSDQSAIQKKHAAITAAQSLEKEANHFLTTQLAGAENTDSAMMAAIDAVALCLKAGIYPATEAVADMRLAAQRVSAQMEHPSSDTDAGGNSAAAKMGSTSGQDANFVPALSSSDNRFTVTVEFGKVPVLWDNWTFKPTKLRPIDEGVSVVGFSPDSTQFGVASLNGKVWTWDIHRKPTGPRPSEKKFLEALGIDSDARATGKFYKGNEAKKDDAWDDYNHVITEWFINAVEMITREYDNNDRKGFPTLKSQPEGSLFTDKANAARKRAATDTQGAKHLLAETLQEFHIAQNDPGAILADMYVSCARRNILRSALKEAAENYKLAAALKRGSDFAKRVDALEKVETGNTYAFKHEFDKAEQSYREAVGLDKSLATLAPGILKSATDLKAESEKNNIEEMKTLLDQANGEAVAGHRDEAIKLYKKAKEKAPDVLAQLDPKAEVEKRSWILPTAQVKMNEGYAAAISGNRERAVQLFEETIALDPRQSSWLNPQAEVDKYVSPTASLPPSPTEAQHAASPETPPLAPTEVAVPLAVPGVSANAQPSATPTSSPDSTVAVTPAGSPP